MRVDEAIERRKSVRSYTGIKVAKDVIEKIINSGRLAPTARGVQPWEFVIVLDDNMLENISKKVPNAPFIKQAGCLVAVFCKDTVYYLEDGSAATENILLAATGLGVGSCWIAGDKKDYVSYVKNTLNVPDGYKLVSLISLGYENVSEGEKDRQKRGLTNVIHWERF